MPSPSFSSPATTSSLRSPSLVSFSTSISCHVTFPVPSTHPPPQFGRFKVVEHRRRYPLSPPSVNGAVPLRPSQATPTPPACSPCCRPAHACAAFARPPSERRHLYVPCMPMSHHHALLATPPPPHFGHRPTLLHRCLPALPPSQAASSFLFVCFVFSSFFLLTHLQVGPFFS